MNKTTPNYLLVAVALLYSVFLFAQADAKIFVSYGNPPISIANGGTVNFGSSTEIAFTITNVPDQGNPSLSLANPEITLSNSNFTYSSPVTQYNIKRGETSVFKLRKNNFACNSSPQSTVVTIHSNANNFPNFSFTITYTNSPSISVLGGTPTQPIPNGQTIPTSATGTLFGTVDVNSSSTRTYAVVNSGTCPLDLGTLTCFGYNPSTGSQSPDFSIINLTATTINPGAVAYLVVRFMPLAPGIKEAIISIPNNDVSNSPYSFVISGEAYNPTVTGPGGGNPDFRLWLKATRGINLTNGAKVPLWKDLGSLGKDATQTTVENQPTFIDAASGNINFNPVVKFQNDGVSLSQFLFNNDNGYYTHETFIVMEPDVAIDGTNGPMTIISGTSAANPSYSLIAGEHTGIGFGDFSSRLANERLWFNQWQTTAAIPYFSVGDAVGNYSKAGIINSRNKTTTASDGIDMLFNTNNIGSLTSVSTTFSNLGYLDGSVWKGTPYNIGKNINSGTVYGNLNGRVAEILSYASRVLDVNRPKIETYLAIKYGITLGVNGSSKDYINSNGTIIWDTAANNGFNYNIAGLGKDIASDLYQKQSKSIYDINEVTIGLGEIATTNSANINEFKKDYDFLVWGSDNGTYTASGTNTTVINGGLTTSTTRINKKWKIVETKDDVAGDVGNVFVGIPLTAFSAFPKQADEEYALIVSDNPAFNDADIIDIIPLKSDGNGNLQTWYDFDGIKYFTFGKALKLTTKNHVNITAVGPEFLVGEYALNLNSGSFTVGCWIRNDGTSATNKTIFGKGTNLEIRLNAQNKIEALWDGASRFVSNTIVADGKWHNIVAVYYVGSADFYIDGVIESTTFNLKNPSPNFSRFSVGSLYIDKNTIINPFLGEIDEIHIWDMALSSGQINYLMNQEIEKYTDGTATGKVLPQNIAKNEFKTIPWTKLKAYYDFNAFYGTTVEGLTDERNFLRIKYLIKNKNILKPQTAPLPYETIADGEWNSTNSAMWKNGDIQTIPNSFSIVPGAMTVNGNIVKIKNNVTSVGNKTVLGLFVDGTDVATYKTLSANNDTKIQVSHYLKLDGLIDLTGRSQLVQTLNSDLDATSIGFIKRNQQGTSNRFNYNYWSSPVGPINGSTNNNNYAVTDVFKDGTTTAPQNINWIGGYNGSVSPLSLARYWLYKFQNGTEYANWVQFTENDEIKPSQGFTLKGAGAVDPSNSVIQNYTFKGKPYNGLINGNSVLPDNLFLVGNPYPSALDAFQFIKDNISVANGGNNAKDIIDGTLYFWEHSPTNDTHVLSGYTGGYATLTLVGGVAPVAPDGISGKGTSNKVPYQYIPVGQGFFVNGDVSIATTEPIIFNNNQRAFIKEDAFDDIPQPISNTLFKTTGSKNKNVDHFSANSNDIVYNNYNTKIRLGFDSNSNFHRQLLIGFMDEKATDGVDVGYDGYQLDTQKTDLYFYIDELKYSIEGVGAFDVSKTYPLGLKIDTTGTVKLMVDATEFLPANINILIHDKETAAYYDITKEAAKLTLSAGTYNSRFELAFAKEISTEISTVELPETMLIYNNEIKQKLFVVKNQGVIVKGIAVYNILGQRLISIDKISNLDTIEIPFNVQEGVYIVKIDTDNGTISQKVLKQK